MSDTSASLFAAVKRIAGKLDLDDDHQLEKACEHLLRSVGQKRRADVENELISIALDGDVAEEELAESDRSRLVQKGFTELVCSALQALDGDPKQDS